MKFLSDDRRIVQWRRAIFLFRKFRESEGAFHKAGYSNFRVEQTLHGMEESSPDLIGWRVGDYKKDWALIVELTLGDHDKTKQLRKYSEITPAQLSTIGISASNSPDVILGTNTPSKLNPGYCNIILGENLSIENIDHVKDPDLRKNLEDSVETDLVHIPSLHFTIVPESKFMEIRAGIAPGIIRRFNSGDDGFTDEDIAMEALDFLVEHMDLSVKNKVVSQVHIQLSNLFEKNLKDYVIRTDDGRYLLTDKGRSVKDNSQSKEKISKAINVWMNTKTLEAYDVSNDT